MPPAENELPSEAILVNNQSNSNENSNHGPHGKKLTLLPLAALIFYEVSGGPYGLEESVEYGGAFLAIMGVIILPFVWSIPEALVTAELGTLFPENGGYVLWVTEAFGPFWGFQEGWLKWLSGIIDNALYPILFLDYVVEIFPIFSSGILRKLALLFQIIVLTYLNYRGLTIVGFTAIILTIFSIFPFLIMGLLAIPKIEVSRWFVCNLKAVNWRNYINVLFWNLNYWDSVSTLVGEVDNPKQTLPKALLYAVVFVILTYLIPLLAGTGAVDVAYSDWDDGFFAYVAKSIGGKFLSYWVLVGAAFSNMGLFEAEMSSDSFQLLGMAEKGLLPEIFCLRSKYGTPVLGILFSATGVFALSSLSVTEIVESLNFLYCIGMLLQFAAFIWLRIKRKDAERPYKIPLGLNGVCMMLSIPSILLILVMCIASKKTIIISFVSTVLGIIAYPIMMHVKKRKWLKFVESEQSQNPTLLKTPESNSPYLGDDPIFFPQQSLLKTPEGNLPYLSDDPIFFPLHSLSSEDENENVNKNEKLRINGVVKE